MSHLAELRMDVAIASGRRQLAKLAKHNHCSDLLAACCSDRPLQIHHVQLLPDDPTHHEGFPQVAVIV